MLYGLTLELYKYETDLITKKDKTKALLYLI